MNHDGLRTLDIKFNLGLRASFLEDTLKVFLRNLLISEPSRDGQAEGSPAGCRLGTP